MARGEERADDRRSAALDVSLPSVALLLTFTVATLVTRGGLGSRAEHMGWWFFAISGAALAGLAGTSTLLWLARRGREIPGSVTLLFAILPWLTGLGGLRFGMHRLVDAGTGGVRGLRRGERQRGVWCDPLDGSAERDRNRVGAAHGARGSTARADDRRRHLGAGRMRRTGARDRRGGRRQSDAPTTRRSARGLGRGCRSSRRAISEPTVSGDGIAVYQRSHRLPSRTASMAPS